MLRYQMLNRGSTRGLVSGRGYGWVYGDILEVPEGEFDHLSSSDARLLTRKAPVTQETRPHVVSSLKVGEPYGRGFWPVLNEAGERVGTIRAKEEEVDEKLAEFQKSL